MFVRLKLIHLQVWRHNKSTGFFSRSVGGGEKSWAKRYFIQLSTMHEVNALITDIKERLKRMQIEETVGEGKVIWSDVEKPFVLKVCMRIFIKRCIFWSIISFCCCLQFENIRCVCNLFSILTIKYFLNAYEKYKYNEAIYIFIYNFF